MNAWKVVLATLVIFVAGILTGATLVRFAQGGPKAWRAQPRPAVESRAPLPPVVPPNPNPANPPNGAPTPPASGAQNGLLSREFVQILEHRLQLTRDQRERIGKIMAEGQERVRELRARIDPELRRELLHAREQIRSVLTPEQREQFEQLMKRPARRNDRGEADRRPHNPAAPPVEAPAP